MPSIIGDLHGLALYSWVFTAYMMASAVTVPIYGKPSDSYGRKPFYVTGLVLFMVGSAISGQAHTMMQLVLARAGQGLGAGAMLSMPRATIGDIFTPRERGRWMGVIGGVFGLASIIGPTLGGWITDTLGWRWVFYINLPIAAVALVMVLISLPKVRSEHRAHLDWTGISLLVVGLLPILLGFTWAGTRYPWASWQIVALFVGGALVLLGFVFVELRVPDAVLAPTLFKNRTFTSPIIVQLLVSMGLFGAFMYLPLYTQGVLGLSAAQSGAVMTPMMIAFIVSSIVGGQLLTRTGRYKTQAYITAAIMIVGMYLLMRMTASTSYFTVIRNVVVLGLGVGALMPLLNVAVQNAFPYRIMGMVNSTQQFASSLGGVIAAPILGTLMTKTFTHRLPTLLSTPLKRSLASLPPALRSQVSNPEPLTSSSAQNFLRLQFQKVGHSGVALYNAFIHAVRVAFTGGMHDMFFAGLLFAIAAFIGTFFLKEVPLKSQDYFENASSAGDADEPETPAVLTIASAVGSGATEIAEKLSERLNMPLTRPMSEGPDRGTLMNQELAVALDAEGDSEEGHLMTTIAHILTLSGVNVPLAPNEVREEEALQRHLEQTILDASKQSAILVGYLPSLLLETRLKTFHVYLKSELEIRVQRVANRRAIPANTAKALIDKIERVRKAFVHQCYAKNPEDLTLNDLVVDATLWPEEKVIDFIVAAYQQRRRVNP